MRESFVASKLQNEPGEKKKDKLSSPALALGAIAGASVDMAVSDYFAGNNLLQK